MSSVAGVAEANNFFSSEVPRLLEDAGLEPRADEFGGTGLFATRDLPAGFCLRIPRSQIFSEEAAKATELGRLLQSKGEFSGEEICACVLGHAWEHPAESRFGLVVFCACNAVR